MCRVMVRAMLSFIQENGIVVNKLKPAIDVVTGAMGITYNLITLTKDNLIDIMYQFNTDVWDIFKNVNLADAESWLNKIDLTKVIQNYSLGSFA